MVLLQGLQSAVNYTLYVAGRDLQAQPNYANPVKLLNVSTPSMSLAPCFEVAMGLLIALFQRQRQVPLVIDPNLYAVMAVHVVCSIGHHGAMSMIQSL